MFLSIKRAVVSWRRRNEFLDGGLYLVAPGTGSVLPPAQPRGGGGGDGPSILGNSRHGYRRSRLPSLLFPRHHHHERHVHLYFLHCLHHRGPSGGVPPIRDGGAGQPGSHRPGENPGRGQPGHPPGARDPGLCRDGRCYVPAGSFRRFVSLPLSPFLRYYGHGVLAGLENRLHTGVSHPHELGAPSPLDGLGGGLRRQFLPLVKDLHGSGSSHLRRGGRPAGTFSRLRPGASAVPNPLPDRALGSVPLFLRAFLLGDRKKRRKEIMMESNSSLKQWLAAGLGIACLVILGVRVMNSRHSELFQKSGTSAPDFSFQERSGKSFSSDELKGKVWVVDFIFTTCAGT